ncbi:protein FAM8A1 isoform X2 [Cephus cinctus]|uniref:Protein FAM8A1 isoform X2 n=1 Tax=Cephus cinctus TaxID=211228 RepID=A0AAJ7BJU3_CEPCN|nr:protein FAM8A1 isoform X2 [Cephus cinctus]
MTDDNSGDSKEDKSQENNTTAPLNHPCTVEERAEYFKKLEKWLQEAYAWQSVVAMFPYYVMSSQLLNRTPGVTPFPPQVPPNAGAATATNNDPNNVNATNRQNNVPLRQGGQQEPRGPFRPPGVEGFEYRIPPIWKRFVAEFIDSMVLFIAKFLMSLFNEFYELSIEQYDLDQFQKNLRFDYIMALEMTSELLILELIHRIMVCIFETFFLYRGLNGRIGGATPGKLVMGLRVVQCRSITPIERPDGSDVVLVSPGTDLGLPLAIGRSVVKNLIIALLFPICFALFFFRFNRTGYDLVCNSIVVEDPYRIPNNNRPHQQ